MGQGAEPCLIFIQEKPFMEGFLGKYASIQIGEHIVLYLYYKHYYREQDAR